MSLHKLFLTSVSTDVKVTSIFPQLFWGVEFYTTVCCTQSLSMAIFAEISQGTVATRLECGEMFNKDFIANLLVSLPVNFFENWLGFGKITDKSLVSCFFGSQCR